MKGVFACAVLAAFVCGACNSSMSPAGPSAALRPGGLSLEPMGAFMPQSVPFKGTLTGSQTLTISQPPIGHVNGSATGMATHLGLFTVLFPHTVNIATRLGTGTFTFTAANGDTLTATFIGQAEAGAIVSIVEHATITGGTGRFAGATGTFTVRRQFDPTSGVTEGSFEGTITSVGSTE